MPETTLEKQLDKQHKKKYVFQHEERKSQYHGLEQHIQFFKSSILIQEIQ